MRRERNRPAPLRADPAADLRLAGAAAAAWAAAAAAPHLPAGAVPVAALLGAGAAVLAGVLALLRCRGAGGVLLPAGAAALVLLSAAGSIERATSGPVDEAAASGAPVSAVLRATSDATPVGRNTFTAGERFLVEAEAREGSLAGEPFRSAAPIVVIGGEEWKGVGRGDTVRVLGTLRRPRGQGREVAVLFPTTAPVVDKAEGGQRFTQQLREDFRKAAARGGPDDGGLLPGMVLGDRSVLVRDLEKAMKDTGLTHLTAVSGANCSYVLAFLLGACRFLRLPRSVGACTAVTALVGFVLLVRPEPSVLRAAVMGAVGVFALVTGRGRQSLALLFLAVIVLLAADPWLGSSYAFILSVAATSGLVLAGPLVAARLSSVLPETIAQLVSIPITAQLFCTPILVLLEPSLPVYAVPANIAVAPVIPFVTIIGMLAAVALVLWPPAAPALVSAARAGTWWVASVARAGSEAPFGQLPWTPGLPGVLLAAAASAGILLLLIRGPRLPPLPRRVRNAAVPLYIAAGCLIGLVLITVVPLRGPAVPSAWLLAACDVGQGDAFVVRSGDGRAVVIDAGPDPGAVDDCLRGLSVETVDLLVLTHLHEDHYSGVSGVFRGRSVAAVAYSSAEPRLPPEITELTRGAGLEPSRLTAGNSFTTGKARWSVLWPSSVHRATPENDASAVLLAEIPAPDGVIRALFTGDIEQDASERMLTANPDLQRNGVHILKVAHHGARNGGNAMARALAPALALISSGEGNDYGHPHPQVIAALHKARIHAARTDRLGSFTVLLDGAALQVHPLP